MSSPERKPIRSTSTQFNKGSMQLSFLIKDKPLLTVAASYRTFETGKPVRTMSLPIAFILYRSAPIHYNLCNCSRGRIGIIVLCNRQY